MAAGVALLAVVPLVVNVATAPALDVVGETLGTGLGVAAVEGGAITGLVEALGGAGLVAVVGGGALFGTGVFEAGAEDAVSVVGLDDD